MAFTPLGGAAAFSFDSGKISLNSAWVKQLRNDYAGTTGQRQDAIPSTRFLSATTVAMSETVVRRRWWCVPWSLSAGCTDHATVQVTRFMNRSLDSR
jgi:hypothetical protein